MKNGYGILLIFFILSSFRTFGQNTAVNEKRGTIRVKKIGKETKELPGIKKPGALPRITSFNFSNGGHHYKITFPKSYKADLYPLVFNNRGLVLTDATKK